MRLPISNYNYHYTIIVKRKKPKKRNEQEANKCNEGEKNIDLTL